MKNNIKEIRMSEKKSQKELARHLHTTQQAVSYMENRNPRIEPTTMKKIAVFLNRDVEDVFPECRVLK